MGNALEICGDKRTYGTVYISTAGRSVLKARIPGEYKELGAKIADVENAAVFIEFTEALDSDSVSKTAFFVCDSEGGAAIIDTITLSRDLKTVKLAMNEILKEDYMYTVYISESLKSLSQCHVYPDYRKLEFCATELSEGIKNFFDDVADTSKMYSCTEENLKKWIYYDGDDTAMTAKGTNAEAVYCVNGCINDFTVKTIHYSTIHDALWKFYVSSDGKSWTELQKGSLYTSKYVSPPDGAVYSFAAYYTHTSVSGSLKDMGAKYFKICYPTLHDSTSDGGESRGLLEVSLNYRYGTSVTICAEDSVVENPFFIELNFDRQMPQLSVGSFAITDVSGKKYIISAVNMSESLKKCILVMQAPLTDGEYTISIDKSIKSLDGVTVNSAFTEIVFNVKAINSDKIFLSDSVVTVTDDFVNYDARITSACDGVVITPILAVYDGGCPTAVKQLEALRLDAGEFADVCEKAEIQNLTDLSAAVFFWNDCETLTPLRAKEDIVKGTLPRAKADE